MSADVNPDVLARLAEARFELLDQATAETVPYVVNGEQRALLEALHRYKRVIVLKARQQGLSTGACLYDLAYAITHPKHAVCICADTQDNANNLLGKIKGWAQTIIPTEEIVTNNVTSLVLANGSVIDARSSVARAKGGESRTGRSRSYNLLHATELAFWETDSATFSALTSTMGLTGQIIVESTASPAQNLYNEMWHKGPGWHHLFFSVESHAPYVRDPDSLTDAQWAELRDEYGFTSRAHAAWWLWKMHTDLGGDRFRAQREYPCTQAQAFAFAEGRWIHAYLEVAAERTGNDVAGRWTVYPRVDREGRPMPAETVIYGVDTSSGTGGDHSALASLGWGTGHLHRTWSGNQLSVPAFARLIVDAARVDRPHLVVVETNGVGAGLAQLLKEAELPVYEHATNEGEKHVRFGKLRAVIEGGETPVGVDVIEEIKSSIVSREGKYTGRDDLLNAVSFAHKGRSLDPYSAPVPKLDPHYHVVPSRKVRSTVF